MRWSTGVSAAVIAGLVLSTGAGAAAEGPQDLPSPRGQIVQRQNGFDGAVFYLYVPTAASAAVPLPLVITSHSTVTTADQEIGLSCPAPWGCCEGGTAGTKWYQLAENAGNVNGHHQPFIVAAPAMASANGGYQTPWTGETQAARDEQRILAIFDQIANAEAAAFGFAVDRSRVLLTGWSGGGIPTYYVGARHPEIFRMIVSRQGNFDSHMFDTAGDLSGRNYLAVAILAGSSDGVVPLSVHQTASGFFAARGYPAVFDPPADPHLRVLPDAEFPAVPSGHYCHSLAAFDTFMDHLERVAPVPPLIAPVEPDPEIVVTGSPYRRQLKLLQGTPLVAWSVVDAPVGTQVDQAGLVSGWTPVLADIGGPHTLVIRAANDQGFHERAWHVRVFSKADFDRDDDVDQADFGILQTCLSGAGQPSDAGCAPADLDPDGDVDAGDFAVFQGCVGGANRPPACD